LLDHELRKRGMWILFISVPEELARKMAVTLFLWRGKGED